MNKEKEIQNVFLAHQRRYKLMSGDDYTAAQMAAVATRTEYDITKKELINILNGNHE